METPPEEKVAATSHTATNILRAQARTLNAIADRYACPGKEQQNFLQSLDLLYNRVANGGKVVFTAMGKSLKIGEKLAATMNSLGITSLTLHPTEALHGDLGCLNEGDVLIMITSSGSTPELLNLVDYLPPQLCLICITCNSNSPLGRSCHGLLEAHVPAEFSEVNTYGLAAPTMSTTACLAVGDAMCISLNEMLIEDPNMRVNRFGKWHPGGAIGQAYHKKDVSMHIGETKCVELKAEPPRWSVFS